MPPGLRGAAPLALIPIGVVLNVAVGQAVRNGLRLPLYLDSVGTILAGALAGPLVGALTGALSNVAWGLLFGDPKIIAYAITAACVGVAAGIAASLGAFRRPWWAALAGALTGVVAALVSAPISANLYGGSTGGGGEAVQLLLQATGASLLQAATLQGFLSDPLDKMLSFLAVWAILRLLPAAWLARLAPAGVGAASYRVHSRYGVAALLSVAALGITVVFLPAFGSAVFAVFYVAVVLSAWNGGLGPGLLATGFGAAALVLVPYSRADAPGLRAEDWLALCLFLTVSCLIALITDALERANRALGTALAEQRRGEAEVRAVVDSVVEALLLVAPDQRLLRVNRRFEELFGLPAGRVTGRRIDELRPEVERVFADPDALAARVAAAAEDADARFTATFAQIWPQERQLEVFSAPVRGDGGFLGRLYGFRDVTQERELDRMKTEFVSQVSHELRTPLTAIKGFTEMLLDGDAGEINEEQAEYLQICKENVDRLVALINDLLDVSRIEAGRVQLQLQPVDLRAVVDSVVATLRPLIEGKGQTITVDAAPDSPPARADRDRILQVVTNLVSNAHKYTPAGGAIRITVGRDGDRLRLAVRDTGIGIAPEDVARLFTRFFRVDSSLTREVGGTGLGLSIVKSIVELHGGTVSVESTPGSGSTFAFTLPVAAPAGAAPAAPAAPAGERTILVVEEDAALTEAIGARLGRAGFRVETVGGADEAVARIARAAPDAVVLGVRAPGMAGLERTHRLAAALEGGEVPLLLLSILEAPAAPAAPQGPAAPAAPAAPTGRPDQARLLERVNRALAGAAPDGRRVLVIEDDPSVRELLAVALRKQGLEVLEAPDGETGLALAREGRPALILLDLRLPGIDGFAVLEALKRTPDTASVPVIAVTGNEGLWLGARARVLSLGAADFVTKPFELDALIAEIRLLMHDGSGSGGVGPAPARTDADADADPGATGEAREEGHHADTRAGR